MEVDISDKKIKLASQYNFLCQFHIQTLKLINKTKDFVKNEVSDRNDRKNNCFKIISNNKLLFYCYNVLRAA